ncbi:HAMP domain-containing sensor histidine kinase [Bacteriovorax sp. BAL6_X]|uniref:sensor histidine kinase n=1 Tax=Bacteriovorax sp. BAL6_X TaxID=1201290 RepID=UPI0018DE0FA8|nr:HAMP domain-containing sensor histidine kinase [Bacteriovorax sp. BAL6_X]
MNPVSPINKIIRFLALRNPDMPARELSQLGLYIYTVFLTAPLMWGHLVISYFFCQNPLLYQIGIASCLIHFFSPVLYYFFGSLSLALNITILAGFIHEFSWSILTGGFISVSPIWFAVLPMIAGLIGTKRELFLWFILSILATSYLFALHLNGVILQNYLSHSGEVLARVLIMIGFILLNSLFMFAYMVDRDRFYHAIVEKKEQIDTLLTLVGHDISNPLTVVNLSAKRLSKLLTSNEDPDIHKCLTRINSCTSGISNILTQIRDLQSIKQGKVELKFEKVYLNQVIEYLYRVFESKLHDKNISLKYDYSANEHIYFMGNSTALKYQIFGNLLSNAIKFSDIGQEIEISVEERSDGVQVHLIDRGVGIEEELLEVLFENNAIPSKIGTSGEKGTGFGMSIVKTFVELSHGTISVRSKTKDISPDNHGTQFSLLFKKSLFS